MAGTLGKIFGILVRRSGATVAGRVQGQLATDITQATLSSITYQVVRVDALGGETVTGTGTLVIADTVFDTIQTDPRVTVGFNFLAVIPASCFAVGGLTHRVEVTFVPVTGEQFVQIFEGRTV